MITTYPGTPYYDLAVPHASLPDVWTYTHPKTGDRLHAREVDYTVCADYYKGDPNGGYRSFVFTDHLSAEQLVELRDMVERDVRKALNIPFNPGAPALRYEHSMGQGLPDFIHRIGRSRHRSCRRPRCRSGARGRRLGAVQSGHSVITTPFTTWVCSRHCSGAVIGPATAKS